MTTGQVIFYSGVGLLIFTIVLGVAFWLKKPQYIPGNAAYDQGADKNTRKLRSGYPTDHLTVRREPVNCNDFSAVSGTRTHTPKGTGT